MGFLVLIKLLLAVHLKHSSFLPSVEVKPASNNLWIVMPGSACVLSLYVYKMISILELYSTKLRWYLQDCLQTTIDHNFNGCAYYKSNKDSLV
jgi:hypothetical protein